MKSALAALIILLGTASAGMANTFQPITDKQTFLTLLDGKNLSNRLYGVNLSVTSDGKITGKGAAWPITGSWTWENGYFCRAMDWGGDPIPYNCQLVEVRNGNEMRFTVDQGAGDSASFMLR